MDNWDWAMNEVLNEKFFDADLGPDSVLDVLVLNGRDLARIEKFFAATLGWDLALNMPKEMLFDVALGRDGYERVHHGRPGKGARWLFWLRASCRQTNGERESYNA